MSKSQENSQTNTPGASFSTEKEFQDEDYGKEESGGSLVLDVLGSRRDSSYYSAVTEEDELDNPEAESSHTSSFWRRILPTQVVSSRSWHLCNEFLTKNLASDEWHSIKGIHILDGVEAVRLVKFFITSLLFILAYHPLVRSIGWENDSNYAIADFFLYDFNMVALDIVVFFLVGRLFQRRGVDRLWPQIIPMFMGLIYPSWSAELWFLRYSVSSYEIVCRWPWQLFAYAILAVGFGVWLVVLHIRGFQRRRIWVSRFLEVCVTCCIFLFPVMSHPNFHLHHWYFSWMVGMHANLENWWSQMVQAFLWGQYLNGIAVWGRDPILTCAYGYFVSTNIHCAYMQCFYDQHDDDDDDTSGTNTTGYKPFVEADWRNCSASYIP